VGTNSQWMGPANITDPLNNYMYEMHQFFDGQGGQTVCKPNLDVAAVFGGVTQWARSLGAYVPTLHVVITVIGTPDIIVW
jgi:hypothetical protein